MGLFCSLNWLTTASEKCQDKAGAGKRTRAAFSGSCPCISSTVTLHSRSLTGSGTQTHLVLQQKLHGVLQKGHIPCSWIGSNKLKSLIPATRVKGQGHTPSQAPPALKRCKFEIEKKKAIKFKGLKCISSTAAGDKTLGAILPSPGQRRAWNKSGRRGTKETAPNTHKTAEAVCHRHRFGAAMPGALAGGGTADMG